MPGILGSHFYQWAVYDAGGTQTDSLQAMLRNPSRISQLLYTCLHTSLEKFHSVTCCIQILLWAKKKKKKKSWKLSNSSPFQTFHSWSATFCRGTEVCYVQKCTPWAAVHQVFPTSEDFIDTYGKVRTLFWTLSHFGQTIYFNLVNDPFCKPICCHAFQNAGKSLHYEGAFGCH